MFDEIFKRYITTGQLSAEALVPLFLEWDQNFGDGTATPEMVIELVTHLRLDYSIIMHYILKMIGIKKGYRWEEVIDTNGIVINRFFVND